MSRSVQNFPSHSKPKSKPCWKNTETSLPTSRVLPTSESTESNLPPPSPSKKNPYPLPHAMRETLERELDSMLAMGVIEESAAAYASPIVMVKKPDGSTRVRIDYRKLNCHGIRSGAPADCGGDFCKAGRGSLLLEVRPQQRVLASACSRGRSRPHNVHLPSKIFPFSGHAVWARKRTRYFQTSDATCAV